MAKAIEVGTQVAWLLKGRPGRGVMGVVTEVAPAANDTAVTVRITACEDRRDNRQVGGRWSVPIRYLRAL